MDTSNKQFRDILILGGGPAGLAAADVLAMAGTPFIVIEGNSSVGGLARTIQHNGFRFDLGGHRFLTDNKKLEHLVRQALNGEILEVTRSSKILFHNKYYDYPLEPWNALSGLGFITSFKIIFNYALAQIKSRLWHTELVSLEDWIVCHFGRTMFTIFFKDYSEKVWGINCDEIAMEWAAQRIRGLSLFKAIKDAFFPTKDKDVRTLARKFLYPTYGFGRICEGLNSRILKGNNNEVLTRARIVGIQHAGQRIESITVQRGEDTHVYGANEFIGSIPITAVVNLLDPAAPPEILEAASKLKFRDLIIVTVMIDRDRVTDQTWIYIPDPEVPFGRIHEPKNWSTVMAPAGKTHLVTEYFCFNSDPIWLQTNQELTELTVKHLHKLGFIKPDEVIDSVVLRIPKAYPLFAVNYMKHYEQVFHYLEGFVNLHLIGRAGKFKYYNTDHAMESGIAAAENIVARNQNSVFERLKELQPF
ncbi:MAG: FAD-dependent oxidoreductase [Xanthomonadales bacterium]